MPGSPRSFVRSIPSPRSLGQLVSEFGLEHSGSLDGVEITGVTLRTGDLHPGDLYVGIPGAHRHGASFAAEAARGRRGRARSPTRRAPSSPRTRAARRPRRLSARRARRRLGVGLPHRASDPPLLFGITGTNGKTTTSYLLEGDPAPARPRDGPELDGRAPHRRPHGRQPAHHARGERDARPAGPHARERGARRRRRGQRAGAQPQPRRRPRLRRRGVHEPQPRPPRRLRRHGGVLPGEAAAVPARPGQARGRLASTRRTGSASSTRRACR